MRLGEVSRCARGLVLLGPLHHDDWSDSMDTIAKVECRPLTEVDLAEK